MDFFLQIQPPTATAQEKQVRVVHGKPLFYDPAPVKEDTAAKKENARAPSENSSIKRGTGARASTEPAAEKADARPSVRSRLMALQAAAERDGTAPTKDTVREAIQKAMPTRE